MVEEAVDAAVGYLLDRRGPDGLWTDFETLAGESDGWVSAYVAAALAATGDGSAVEAARRAWRRLRWRRPWSAGWGYNRRVPADADSTAWALRLADRLGAPGRLTRWRARRFLAKHVGPDGGVATYHADGPIRRFTGLSGDVSFDGWCRPHPSVTAAALPWLRGPDRAAALEFLREAQADDGSWPSYWWPDRAYATGLAAAALDRTGDTADRRRARAAVEWALDRLEGRESVPSPFVGDGSAFATACCLRILRLGSVPEPRGGRPVALDGGAGAGPRDGERGSEDGVRNAADRAAAWLRTSQRPDGSWDASAALRIPPPDVTDPTTYRGWEDGGLGGGSVQTDQHRTFTTATALSALRRSGGSAE